MDRLKVFSDQEYGAWQKKSLDSFGNLKLSGPGNYTRLMPFGFDAVEYNPLKGFYDEAEAYRARNAPVKITLRRPLSGQNS